MTTHNRTRYPNFPSLKSDHFLRIAIRNSFVEKHIAQKSAIKHQLDRLILAIISQFPIPVDHVDLHQSIKKAYQIFAKFSLIEYQTQTKFILRKFPAQWGNSYVRIMISKSKTEETTDLLAKLKL